MDNHIVNPYFEQRMAAAAGMQDAWQFVLDMLDGEIVEAGRHGWDPGQSRMLVFATFINALLTPIMGNSSGPVGE